jgi:GWxTD domain-containing protein
MNDMKGMVLTAALMLAAVALSASCSVGQPVELPACAPATPHFCADAAYFLSNGSPRLEVYLLICNEGLQFVKTEEGFLASADVLVVLTDSKKRQIAGDTYRVRLSTPKYSETTSVDSCVTRTMSFKAEPGDFGMEMAMFDRDSRRKSAVEAKIRIPSAEDLPALSDVIFLSAGGGGGASRWRGLRPNVRRTYDTSAEEVRFYYEVYHEDPADSVIVDIDVLDASETVVYEASEGSVGTGTSAHVDSIPSGDLANGPYVLRIAMVGTDGKRRHERLKEFEIFTESSYFGRDAEAAADLLAYIASQGLIDAYVDASPQDRKRIWKQFWREKDPTPGTPRNEFYEEHVKRFRYANEKFKASMTEGWRTDRGRIYILHGEPDEIENYPTEVGRNPMEIWYYFSRGRRFVFVDETGFGDYVLVTEQ